MLDPITLTLLQNRFQQIADEMDVRLDQAAFSPVISEGRDRCSGIYDRDGGQLVAQSSTGTPIHAGTMHFTARAIAALPGGHRPGDIFICNDPYVGGTHLQDVRLLMPVYFEEEVVCFVASCGHWPDIGGSVPGGFATQAIEIEQEGVRIPPIRLYREGTLNEDVLALLLSNVRVRTQRLGDLQAQVASLRAGEAEILKTVSEYGLQTIRDAIVELRRRSARLMREVIANIAPGVYYFEDALDNDGVEDEPLWVRLKLTAGHERLVFDFADSSSACQGPLNSPFACTFSAVYIALKHVFTHIPLNAGCFEPIEVIAPPGTFLHAAYPRPVSGCASEVSQRVVDTVFGALAQAIPHLLTGAPVGTAINLVMGGTDPRSSDPYVFYFYSGGGHGGYPDGDGISNAATAIGLSLTPPLEICEQQAPLMFEEYALRENSCGPGQTRGGLGIAYTIRLTRGEARIAFLGDRAKRPPFGIVGGGSGAQTRIDLICGGQQLSPPMLSKGANIALCAGDRVRVQSPGGGGYGPPGRRADAAVRTDLVRGYISRGYAERHYPDQLSRLDSELAAVDESS